MSVLKTSYYDVKKNNSIALLNVTTLARADIAFIRDYVTTVYAQTGQIELSFISGSTDESELEQAYNAVLDAIRAITKKTDIEQELLFVFALITKRPHEAELTRKFMIEVENALQVIA